MEWIHAFSSHKRCLVRNKTLLQHTHNLDVAIFVDNMAAVVWITVIFLCLADDSFTIYVSDCFEFNLELSAISTGDYKNIAISDVKNIDLNTSI